MLLSSTHGSILRDNEIKGENLMTEHTLISYDRSQAVKDFISLVRDMRENQKQYFQIRSRYYLAESKGLEARVDRALQWFAEEGERI